MPPVASGSAGKTIRSVSALTFVNEDSGFESINAAAIDSLKVRQNMDTGVQTTSGGVGSAYQ